MQGVTIAFAWLTFAAIFTTMILYIVSAKYSMKAAPTDADTKEAKKLAMVAFVVMVIGLIFVLIAAISASCDGGAGKILRGWRDRFMRSGGVI